MESQVVRRRVNMIAAHLAAHDIFTVTTHLFPMSCSSSLNSAIPRYDNRMYYARQSSNSQACFMRLNSSEQGSCTESTSPFKPNGCAEKSSSASEGPMFSRPTNKKFQYTAQGNGSEWSPRMDVAESGSMYAISIEHPGVNISDIKVEVSDKSLIVSGNRSTQCKVASYLTDLVSAYTKRRLYRDHTEFSGLFQVMLIKIASQLSLWTDFYRLQSRNFEKQGNQSRQIFRYQI